MDLHELLKRKDVPEDIKAIIRKDIEFHHQARQKLEQSEQKYRTLVQTIPDIVYCIDEKGRFTFLNEAITKLGYSPGELIGQHFSKILHPRDIKNVSSTSVLAKYRGKITGKQAPKLFDERRTRNRKTTNLEVRLISREEKTSTALIMEVAASGLYTTDADNPGKTFLGTIGVIRDITELKKAEEALRSSQKQIEHLEKFLRICASCHKVLIPHSDENKMDNWVLLETYLSEKTDTIFSHGLCPECYQKAMASLK